jgi:heptosyltransferase-3
VRAWGADPDPLPPPLTSTSQEEDAAASLLRGLPPGFLALHPGSGAPAKTWPTDRFLALAAVLSPGRPWLLVRGPAESAVSAPPGAVVAHELPLRVLGAVLARAGLFVGNDSGVSHLAAAAGAPTLSLFGPTTPEVWSPLGPRVVTLRAPGGAMSEISVDEVAAKAAALR